MSRTIGARVDAGRASPIDRTRAELELVSAEMRLEQARRESAAARSALVHAMGLTNDTFGELRADFERLRTVPAWGDVRVLAANNPELARWQAEIARRESAVALERARRWPDLTVTAGWRSAGTERRRSTVYDASGVVSGSGRTSFDDDRDDTFLLSFSLPLPLFDRNSGNVKEAGYLVSRATAQSRADEVALDAALYATWQSLKSAEAEASRSRDDLVPRAREIFDAVDAGYREGKFGYLDVLDAQRTLAESRIQLADAYAAFHSIFVDLERLTGRVVTMSDGPVH
jgi:cobalt-zinc-cadmium efflux system outer membrane protein